MRQEIIGLYDDYTHERLDRRVFMDRLATLAGGTAAAAALLPMLRNNYAKAAIVPDGRSRPADRAGDLPGRDRRGPGLPRAPGRMPRASCRACVVIHENRGLNPHIEDVARRMALEGFVALAPDFLSPQGGTPEDEDQAREMIGQLDPAQTVAERAWPRSTFLKSHEASTGQVGVVGFCWGGALANQVAVNSPDVGAAVPFYGRQPASEDVGPDRGAAAPALRRDRRAHQRRHRRLRAGARGGRRGLHDPYVRRAPTTPSTTTPTRRATTRRRPSSPGRARSIS